MTKAGRKELRMTVEMIALTEAAAEAAGVTWSEWMTGAAADKLSRAGERGWESRVLKAIRTLDLAPAKRRRRRRDR